MRRCINVSEAIDNWLAIHCVCLPLRENGVMVSYPSNFLMCSRNDKFFEKNLKTYNAQLKTMQFSHCINKNRQNKSPSLVSNNKPKQCGKLMDVTVLNIFLNSFKVSHNRQPKSFTITLSPRPL